MWAGCVLDPGLSCPWPKNGPQPLDLATSPHSAGPARDSRTFGRSARGALGGRNYVGRVSHQHDLACDSTRLDFFLGEPASGISYVFIINTKGLRVRTASLGPECITLRIAVGARAHLVGTGWRFCARGAENSRSRPPLPPGAPDPPSDFSLGGRSRAGLPDPRPECARRTRWAQLCGPSIPPTRPCMRLYQTRLFSR